MDKVIKLLLLSFCVINGSFAQDGFDKVTITTIKVSSNIYMLQGMGGNIGLSVGDDGAFLIDDQFAPLSEKILAAIRVVSDKPVRFVINTHWHFDHTGGNENFGKQGAIIVAHDNVRERLKNGAIIKAFNKTVDPAPTGALPVITFADSITFHWNGETMQVIHYAQAHSDGDAVIYFKNANIVHAGDLYFNGLYPFIDGSSGGSFPGMINSVNEILKRIDNKTKIIPGHGPLSNKKELTEYRDMLKTVYKRLSKMKRKGKSIEEVLAAKPTAEFDTKWGNGFLKPNAWLEIVYDTL